MHQDVVDDLEVAEADGPLTASCFGDVASYLRYNLGATASSLGSSCAAIGRALI